MFELSPEELKKKICDNLSSAPECSTQKTNSQKVKKKDSPAEVKNVAPAAKGFSYKNEM